MITNGLDGAPAVETERRLQLGTRIKEVEGNTAPESE